MRWPPEAASLRYAAAARRLWRLAACARQCIAALWDGATFFARPTAPARGAVRAVIGVSYAYL